MDTFLLIFEGLREHDFHNHFAVATTVKSAKLQNGAARPFLQ